MGGKTNLDAFGNAASFVGQENWDLWYDDNNNKTGRYIHGNEVDQPLAHYYDLGGTTKEFWYHKDRQGSVVNVTDGSGTIVNTVTYEGFGRFTETNKDFKAGVQGMYKWTGRAYDYESGLQYNRARYYDPNFLGRWISQDPIGFDAGDSNLYRYVKNGYLGARDPSGLDRLYYDRETFKLWWVPDSLGGSAAGQKGFVRPFVISERPLVTEKFELLERFGGKEHSYEELEKLAGAHRTGDLFIAAKATQEQVENLVIQTLTNGKVAERAAFDENGRRQLPLFTKERGFGVKNGVYVYRRFGMNIAPCVVCHGKDGSGRIPGLTPTDSIVNGRFYLSGTNANIIRNYTAGTAGGFVSTPIDIANLAKSQYGIVVHGDRTFSLFLNTDQLRNGIQSSLGAENNSLVTKAGQYAGNELFMSIATAGTAKGVKLLKEARLFRPRRFSLPRASELDIPPLFTGSQRRRFGQH